MAATFLLVWLRVPQPDVRRNPHPVTLAHAAREYGALVRRSDVTAAAGAYFLMFLGLSLYVVYLPTWLEGTMGASANQIALLFLVGGVANVLVGPQAGRLSDHVGRRGIILLSCVGLSAVMALTTFVIQDIRTAYPYFFVVVALVAMRIGPFSALLTALVRDDRRGTLMSLTIALGQIGFAAGGTAAGLFYAGIGYGATTLIASASVLGTGLLVAFRVPEPPPGTHGVPGPSTSAQPGLGLPGGTGGPPE
jgi:predicted MFS family arabinose efflux permease